MSRQYDVITIRPDCIATEGGNHQDQSPVNFHLKNVNRTDYSGFCSRLRKVNEDSSFLVLG